MSFVSKENKQNLIEQLYKYRLENMLTLKQLSDELNLPLTTISNWFHGKNNPSDIASAMLHKFLTDKGYNVTLF